MFDSAPDAPSLTEACGPDIGSYLAARTATVTALAAAAETARQAGVRLTLLDETIPMQAYATGHGFDPSRELVRAELAVDPRTGPHETRHPHRVAPSPRITRPANHKPLTFFAVTPPRALATFA